MRGKGGGPKTARGKAAASRNAIRHGLLSESPAIPDVEDERDWQRHLDGIAASLKPEGWHESFMVNRIAALLWRLHRAQRYETRVIRAYIATVPGYMSANAVFNQNALNIPIDESITLEKVGYAIDYRMLPEDDRVAIIMRYEAHLHRQYIQTLHELEAIQARRQGGHVPLTRLDISTPPGT